MISIKIWFKKIILLWIMDIYLKKMKENIK